MNVVVVVLDTVRPDSLGCNGNPVCKTPTLDRLASEGAILTNSYAEFPVTVPTRSSLFAGIYTWTNRPWTPLRTYDLRLAQIFKDNGYITGAFSDSPFRAVVGMDVGFDEFNEFPSKLQPAPEAPEGPVDYMNAGFPPDAPDEQKHWKNCVEGYLNYFPKKFGKIGMDLLLDRATGWIDEKKDEDSPFFLWIDTFQPHEPWIPPAPYDTMYQDPNYSGRFLPLPKGPSIDWMEPGELEHVVGLYMGEVTYTDMLLQRFFDHLDERGLAEDTLVVLLSDHGQPFGDHGTIRKFGVPLYDELSKIVWIMRKPGLIEPGARMEGFAQTPDLMPTLIDMCGLDFNPPPSVWVGVGGLSAMNGVSLGPMLRKEEESVRDRVYIGAFGIRAGIRAGNLKFLDHRGEKPNEMFDLASDPKEKINLLEESPDAGDELHRELWEFQSRWSGILAWRDAPAEPDPKRVKAQPPW